MNRSAPALAVAIIIMLSILGTCLYYVGRSLHGLLRVLIPNQYLPVFIACCVFFALVMVLSFMPVGMPAKKGLVWLASFLMGLFACSLMAFGLSDVLLLAGRLVRLVPSPAPDGFNAAVSWVVAAAIAVMACYGTFHGRQIKQASYAVALDKPSGLDSLNVVLIADIHLGYLNDERWLARVVNEVNALEPDIVCIAGDIYNDNLRALADPDTAALEFSRIESAYGVYACLGNHDGGATFADMLALLEQGNVYVLYDEYVVIDNKLVIVGRADSSPIREQGQPRRNLPEVLADVDKSLPVIVIDHNPANIGEYGEGIDLVLAGHTHRGQVFPGNLVTSRMFTVDYGHYQAADGGPHVVVTSGAGVWGVPLRIGTDNEVVGITVSFKAEEDSVSFTSSPHQYRHHLAASP